jgi:uncharacterized protein
MANTNQIPVQSKAELITRLRNNADTIKSFGVHRLGIFGSFSRNEMNSDSDVDFLVDFDNERKTYKNFIHLAYFLEELCGRKIELVTPQGLSKYIGPKILKSTEYVALSA